MGIFDFLKRRPVGRSVEELAEHVRIPAPELTAIRPAYREARIPKRRGGYRVLHIPDPPLKHVQRRLVRRVFAWLCVHDRAFAYRRGSSIVGHAALHAGKDVVVTLDLEDFFLHTRADRVHANFLAFGWAADAATLLTRLTTWEGSLPQGAPTSPILSNLVNTRLDARLDGLARRFDTAYSRYADDLVFSLSGRDRPPVGRLIRCAKLIVSDEGYTLHQGRKLHIRRRHKRQCLAGLVVNDRPRLPRAQRRRLRAVRHHLAHGRSATLSAQQLAGWDALEDMIDRQTGDP